MLEKTKSCDLCSTCRNASGCTFTRDTQKPVFYCEEFEVDISSLAAPVENKNSLQNQSVDAEGGNPAKFIGLCGNCQDSGTCSFPKPEGGIWHCEEYR